MGPEHFISSGLVDERHCRKIFFHTYSKWLGSLSLSPHTLPTHVLRESKFVHAGLPTPAETDQAESQSQKNELERDL